MDWIDFITKVGLPTAMVVYFMWRDREREKRTNSKEDQTSAAFAALNQRQFELTSKCIEAVTTSNELKRELKLVIEHMCQADLPSLRKSGAIPILGKNAHEIDV